jgi:hypothetical protein
MKTFDNFSAIEDLSMDSSFFNITTSAIPTKAENISAITSIYQNLKNRNVNFVDDILGREVRNYSIFGSEGFYYEPIFSSPTFLNLKLSTQQISDLANGIKGLYISEGSNINPSQNVKSFRVQAQNLFPELKKTWGFYGDGFKNNIISSLSQEYIDVFKEPFFSENLSQQDKVDINGELVGVALRDDLSMNEKKNLFMDIIKIYAPSLPSSSGSIDLSTTEEERAEGATTDSKINITKYAIIGGVLIVGGIATWLILRKK